MFINNLKKYEAHMKKRRKKKIPKKRNEQAQALHSPIFHKKVIPVKKKEPPKVNDDWGN